MAPASRHTDSGDNGSLRMVPSVIYNMWFDSEKPYLALVLVSLIGSGRISGQGGVPLELRTDAV